MEDYYGRSVKYIMVDGIQRLYYLGPHGEGIIYEDTLGEFISVNNEKRFWRGINNINTLDLNEISFIEPFTLTIYKPDSIERNL